MVGNGGRKGRITPVDAEYMRQQTEQQAAFDEDRKLNRFLNRERSSAYWFAATKWGILGLVTGTILGGVGMYYASISTIDMAQEAISKGEMIANFRREQAAPSPNQTPPAQPAP